jgi:hypothetical protein
MTLEPADCRPQRTYEWCVVQHIPNSVKHSIKMLTRSLDTAEKILEYTTAVANALRDVATAMRIPFLVSFCTLSLTIIPVVQVCQSDR